MSKLERRGTTLVDILVVAQALDEDEIRQIEAFSGNKPNPESLALSIMNTNGIRFTFVDKETGEPLAVGGYVQTGPVIFRSFFLANPRVWEEFGREMTDLARESVTEIKEALGNPRLETYALADRKKAHQWYEKIGLEYDATLKGFGVNGESAVLYSTVGEPSRIETANVAELNAVAGDQRTH